MVNLNHTHHFLDLAEEILFIFHQTNIDQYIQNIIVVAKSSKCGHDQLYIHVLL